MIACATYAARNPAVSKNQNIILKYEPDIFTCIQNTQDGFVINSKVLDALLRNFVYKLLWLKVIMWSISKNHKFMCIVTTTNEITTTTEIIISIVVENEFQT